MTVLDKVHAIKDFINRVISIVYGVNSRGFITDILESSDYPKHYDWNRKVSDSYMYMSAGKLNDGIAIVYNMLEVEKNLRVFTVHKNDSSHAKKIMSWITGMDIQKWNLQNIKLEDAYNSVVEFSKCTDEELKLYFKLL